MKKLSFIVLFISFITGVYAQQNATTEEIELFYDDGVYLSEVGVGGNLVWGVMFPSDMLQAFGLQTLTKVALYETAYNQHDLGLDIYIGGENAPSLPISSETFSPSGEVGYHYYELNNPISIDGTQNLWIVFKQLPGQFDLYPAAVSNDVTGNPNGRWVSLDGSHWMDLSVAGMPGYTWMIRAYGITTLGVEEPISNKTTSLYPNPTTGQFTVEGLNVAKVEVYNLVGQKICEQQGSKVVNINATEWNKGIYLVNIIEENGAVVTKKLVVK
jgi:hypothetical protein